MALTDPNLVYVLGGLSLLALILLVMGWRRFSGKNFRAIFGRVSSLLLINILTIATLGVAINNYGDFYTSWSELLGERKAAPLIVDQANSQITVEDLKKATLTQGGSAILHRLVRGDVSGITSQLTIALPPSYVKALTNGVKARSDYRVIEFFPGYPGHESAWIKGMKIVDRVDAAVASRVMPETILVFPHINIYTNFDAECMNIPGGPQIESWATRDVVDYTNTWLGLTPSRWGSVGFSTGAWCATMFTLRHPQQFSMAASIAGYYSPQIAKQISPSIRPKLKSEYSLDPILKLNPPTVALFVVNAPNDPSSHLATVEFLKKVRAPISVTQVDLPGAGHNFQAWKRTLNPLLEWFGKVISAKEYQ